MLNALDYLSFRYSTNSQTTGNCRFNFPPWTTPVSTNASSLPILPSSEEQDLPSSVGVLAKIRPFVGSVYTIEIVVTPRERECLVGLVKFNDSIVDLRYKNKKEIQANL